MSADADFSQMRALAFDLGKAQVSVFPKFRAIVQKTMVDTKTDMRAEAAAAGQAGAQLSSTISYETKETAGGVTATIGPVEGGPGSFAFLYYGNSKNGPIIKDPLFALQRNVDKAIPIFEKILGDIP